MYHVLTMTDIGFSHTYQLVIECSGTSSVFMGKPSCYILYIYIYISIYVCVFIIYQYHIIIISIYLVLWFSQYAFYDVLCLWYWHYHCDYHVLFLRFDYV